MTEPPRRQGTKKLLLGSSADRLCENEIFTHKKYISLHGSASLCGNLKDFVVDKAFSHNLRALEPIGGSTGTERQKLYGPGALLTK